jgi:hypothetical protein
MNARLNHYHIVCPNKFELAEWYKKNLGFEIIQDVEELGERDGPLIISGDGGKTGISIFTHKGSAKKEFAIQCIPSFEISIQDFVTFYREQKKINPDVAVYDHLTSLSIYFFDPMGTRLEFTASNYIEAKSVLESEQVPVKTMNPSHDPAYCVGLTFACI